MDKDSIGMGLLVIGVSFGIGFSIVSWILQGLITIYEFPGTLYIFFGDNSGFIMPIGQAWYIFQKSVIPSLIAGFIAIPIGIVIVALMR